MQDIWPEVVGSYGAGKHNERGVKLLQFCAINNLFIANTIFKHKERRRYTWTSPKQTEMQIDFIIMSKKLKSTLKNCRTYNSAEIGSDHSLVIANLVMKKPKKMKHIAKKPLKRYDTDKLQSKETSKKFASIIGEGFANLLDDEMTPD